MTEPGALVAPSVVRRLLERHNLRADKSFGQNFLVDRSALEAIVRAAQVSVDDTVLEVGPGLGVLTRELAGRAARVVTIELDRRLLPVLDEVLSGHGNVEIVQGDALRFDLRRLPQGSLFVANLPYNVATPLLAAALEATVFRRIVVMIQREVAERLVASPGTSAYGALSLLVAHFARARIVRNVAPGCFYPPPEVTSSVVQLDVHPGASPAPRLFRLIRDSFRHRRKTLANNLQGAGYAREDVTKALAAVGLDPRIRAEELGLTAFRGLLEHLGASQPAGDEPPDEGAGAGND